MARSGPFHTVASVVWKGHMKRLRLEPGRKWLEVPRSACVTKGDHVILNSSGAEVECKTGRVRILPSYVEWDTVSFGDGKLQVAVKEITESEEFEIYQRLSKLHYRSHSIHGRTARLVARCFDPACPSVVGYVELATPFFMNKARSSVLDAPFSSGTISWQSWDIQALRRYIHVMVRIARIVVYPEFRGMRVGQLLVKHAAKFAQTRWQVAGLSPLFLEISADMLKFVPFAERAGMKYVGDTEGNLQRAARDLKYLIRRFGSDRSTQGQFEDISGICDQQAARKDRALQLMLESGRSEKDFLATVSRMSDKPTLRDLAMFDGIISLPKPHFMMGLTDGSSRWLRKRLNILKPKNGHSAPKLSIPALEESIVVRDLSISYFSQVRRTRQTFAVQQAFGIAPDSLRDNVVTDLNLRIDPGKIVLMVGPSGSGKSSLLRIISGSEEKGSPGLSVTGSVAVPPSAVVGEFRRTKSQKPLIELVSRNDTSRGVRLLAVAGISEPFLYLKRFGELSAGQQYRAMLALLLHSGANVWIADEFCTNLDSITAKVVAHNVQSHARKHKVTVIAADPAPNLPSLISRIFSGYGPNWGGLQTRWV